MSEAPLLQVDGLSKRFGRTVACHEVSFELWPGEILGIVGESGSGKTTLLRTITRQLPASEGRVRYRLAAGRDVDVFDLSEAALRQLARREWGFVHQNPRDGLRMGLSAGANVGEPLMALGQRHYGRIRAEVAGWFDRIEMDGERMDERPGGFSGGMQQRLQIARNLVTRPRLVFMDEPTGGLDVSVQARLLDLLRRLVSDLDVACIVVSHDLGVVRMLSHRLLVMRAGRVVEQGLTDQVLDDPHHPYTQLLVSSVLAA